MFRGKTILAACLLGTFSAPAFAQEAPASQSASSQPSSAPSVDSYDLLQSSLATLSASKRVEAQLAWLLENEQHPKAAELRQALEKELAKNATGQDMLLSNMQSLFAGKSNTERVDAIQALTRLGDVRVVGALLYLLREPNETIQKAVVEAFGQLKTPEIEAALQRIVVNPFQSKELRLLACVSLGSQGTESAANSLLDLAINTKLTVTFRSKAREVLLERFPTQTDKLVAREIELKNKGAGGRGLLFGTSVVFGSYTLGSVGILSGNDFSTGLGFVSGAVLGGAGAYLVSEREDVREKDALWLGTGELWGVAGGSLLGLAIAERVEDSFLTNDDEQIIAGLGLLGGLVGFGLNVESRHRQEFNAGQLKGINVGTAASTIYGLSVGEIFLGDSNTSMYLATLSYMGSSLFGSAYASHRFRGIQDPLLFGSTTGWGAALGTMLGGALYEAPNEDDPFFPTRRGDFPIWGGVLGQASGILIGSALVGKHSLTASQVAEIDLIATTNMVLGLGLLGNTPNTSNAESLQAAAFTAAGLGAGAVMVPRFKDTADRLFFTSSSLWGFSSGLLIGEAIARGQEEPSPFLQTLGALTGELGGFVLGGALLGKQNYTSEQVGQLNMVGFANALNGGAIAGLLSEEPETTVAQPLLVGGFGALGLAAGALWVPRLEMDAGDYLLSSLLSAEGAFAMGQLSEERRFDPGDRIREKQDSLITFGLAEGFLLGALMSPKIEITPRQVATTFAAGAYGKFLGAGIPMFFQPEGFGDGFSSSLMALGGVAGTVGGLLIKDELKLTLGDVALTADATLFGLLHGLFLPIILDDPETPGDFDILVGSALTGIGLGGLVGLGLSAKNDFTAADVFWMNTGALWGIWFGTLGSVINASSDGDDDPRQDFAAVLGLADVGLAFTTYLVSKADVNPRLIGYASVGGLAGAAVASLLTSFLSQESDAIILASMVGSGAGLAVGAGVGQKLIDTKPQAKPPSKKTSVDPKASLSESAPNTGFLSQLRMPQLVPVNFQPLRAEQAPIMGLGLRW